MQARGHIGAKVEALHLQLLCRHSVSNKTPSLGPYLLGFRAEWHTISVPDCAAGGFSLEELGSAFREVTKIVAKESRFGTVSVRRVAAVTVASFERVV